MLVGEDGLYGLACSATPWAVGRQVWGPPFPEHRESRTVDPFRSVPLALPKVFSVHNYVHVVHKPQPGRAIGGGRTANQGLDPLIYHNYAQTGLV